MPAPVGGINDLDGLAVMEPQFMIDAMNFFPDTAALVVRRGYKEFTTGLVNAVKTIMDYNRSDGTTQIFAATDLAIFPVTNTNAPASVFAVTNGQFDYTNFATAGAQYLVACNGNETLLYNGTTWSKWIEVGAPANPGEIKNVNPNTFISVQAHKARLWFLVNSSMTAWYLPVDAIGGVAQPFFLGGLFKRGGYLVAMARWSMDTGEGLDDRLVFITSNGEVAVYSGNDPADASDWTLDATYYVGSPLGPRSVAEYGGDILLLSRRGLLPLSTLLQGTEQEIIYSNVLTRRISRTLIQLTASLVPSFPIEVNFHPNMTAVIINLFDEANNRPLQLVMNFLTGAWTKFDYPVRTIKSIDRTIYMGTDNGRVLTITQDGYMDNVPRTGTIGTPISAYAFSAYSYLGDPTVDKHAKLMRPIIQSELAALPSFVMRAVADFRIDKFVQVPTQAQPTGGAKWDQAIWDQAFFIGVENIYRPWVSANVLGYAFAWQMNVSTTTSLGLSALQWVWEPGGLI